MLEFKTIGDVYNAFNQLGCCSFATLDGKGGVESRTAHFFVWGEEGLCLRTMTAKPFYRQLKEDGMVTVCDGRDCVKGDVKAHPGHAPLIYCRLVKRPTCATIA